MKPAYVKPNTYIDYGVTHNDKNPKFKVSDHVRISNTKIFLQRATLQISKVSVIKSKKYCTTEICF